MLTQEETGGSERRPWKPLTPVVAALLTFGIVIVLFLRHDFWNWTSVGPKFLGFIPVGLWWQGLVSLLASGMMWLLVHFAWPGRLEEEADAGEKKRLESREP